jgi:hypothetical protein
VPIGGRSIGRGERNGEEGADDDPDLGGRGGGSGGWSVITLTYGFDVVKVLSWV